MRLQRCPILIVLTQVVILQRPASSFLLNRGFSANSIQRCQHRQHPSSAVGPHALATFDDVNVTDSDTDVTKYKKSSPGWTEHPIKYGIPFDKLKVGQRLRGKVMEKSFHQGATGPKIFFNCGVGRIGSANRWRSVNGMLRLGGGGKSAYARSRVKDLANKGIMDLYVHKIRTDSGQLEVVLSLDNLEKQLTFEEERMPASSLMVGDEMEGRIVKLRPYGALVDVGANRMGMLHCRKVGKLLGKGIYSVGDMEGAGMGRGATVSVAVESNTSKRLFFDFTPGFKQNVKERKEEKRVENVEKKAARERLDASLVFGEQVKGEIVDIKPYGCILQLGENRRGLLHIQTVADAHGKYFAREQGLEVDYPQVCSLTLIL